MKYSGFDNVLHYYSEMSAMGDIPMNVYETESTLPDNARIHNISIPLLMINALDDPLVSWRCVAANKGLMHPSILPSQVKSGNLILLITKAGGHVGWPLGWIPQKRKWEWMNDASSTFAESVQLAIQSGYHMNNNNRHNKDTTSNEEQPENRNLIGDNDGSVDKANEHIEL